MISSSGFPRDCGHILRPFTQPGNRLISNSTQSPIRKLLSYFADRSKPDAFKHLGPQAMIVPPVRIQHMIALLAHSSSEPLRREEISAAVGGLFEDDPRANDISTKGWRGSARKRPQVYGGSPALMFDVAGLVEWLRGRYPRSTTQNVEAETGIPAASVENWLHRRSQPSVEHFTILIAVFGPSLLHSCFRRSPGWVEQAAMRERQREIDEQIARLMSERNGTSHKLDEVLS